MFHNYFQLIARQWRSSWSYTLINLGGLTAGLTVALLLGLWITDELSFDHYFAGHSRLVRLMDTRPSDGGPVTTDLLPPPLVTELHAKYGRFFRHLAIVFPNFPHVLTAGEKKITAAGEWAQPEWPEMLSLKMIRGNRSVLSDPSSALIDQSTATALFGSREPMGQTIRVDNTIEIKVAGVYEDLPANTTFSGTHILLSWNKAPDEMSWMTEALYDWGAAGFWIFAELNDPADRTAASAAIKDILRQHLTGSKEELSLYPMDRWHHNPTVSLFTLIGIFVLLLACINFMNLSTARSERRAREVGIRKTLGSRRSQLIAQFLGESVLMAFLALLLAIGVATLSLPLFNNLAAKNLGIPWANPFFWFTALGFTLGTGLLAGSYPALYLSAFRPIAVLKANRATPRTRSGRTLATLTRKSLVVLQFTVSVSLIIGTIIIYRQIQYAQARSVGYNRDRLLTIRMNTKDIYDAPYSAMRNDLLQTGAVEDMAMTATSVTEQPGLNDSVTWEGKDPRSTPRITTLWISTDYGNTLQWQLLAGRDFSRAFLTDSNAAIINESAARLTGWKDPIGKRIRVNGQDHPVIGVVKDMVMGSPYQPATASIFQLATGDNYILVRIKPLIPMSTALNKIAKVFSKYNPAAPFEFHFIDEDYALQFAGEQQTARLSTIFAALAIFISCLGLFGLASYLAEQRTKEIGIRKVLGADITAIVTLLSADFLKLILLSILIAIPLSAYAMHQWLQSYPYHTSLNAWIFAAAAGLTTLIALLTISFQALKAALANPIHSLRSE